MVARIWHGFTKPQHAAAYEKLLKPELLPGVSKIKGYRGSFLLKNPSANEVEFVTIMLFDSLADIRAVAGEHYDLAIVPDNRRQYLAHYDERVTHFEVASIHGIACLHL